MNEEDFKADHFKNIEELLEHCDLWIKTEDYDAYCRFFDMGAMEELYNYTKQLKQQLKDKDEKISKVIEYCNGSAFEVSTREYGMLNVINYEDVLEILENNKED